MALIQLAATAFIQENKGVCGDFKFQKMSLHRLSRVIFLCHDINARVIRS